MKYCDDRSIGVFVKYLLCQFLQAGVSCPKEISRPKKATEIIFFETPERIFIQE